MPYNITGEMGELGPEGYEGLIGLRGIPGDEIEVSIWLRLL